MGNRSKIALALCVSAFSLCTVAQTPANGQAAPADQPAATRDKHGRLVTSLNAGDFALTEDNRPQTIKSFTRESNLPFRVGLLVDTSRSVSAAMEDERKAAGQFIDQMLPADPNSTTQKDEAFLLHFDREVELL